MIIFRENGRLVINFEGLEVQLSEASKFKWDESVGEPVEIRNLVIKHEWSCFVPGPEELN